jgi:hypothetical protein
MYQNIRLNIITTKQQARCALMDIGAKQGWTMGMF